jgi:hypothetical protein
VGVKLLAAIKGAYTELHSTKLCDENGYSCEGCEGAKELDSLRPVVKVWMEKEGLRGCPSDL